MTVQERQVGRGAGETLALGRAAERLGLKTKDFELAVQLGEVRTVAVGDSGRRRVACEEVERLRRAEGFPETLRSRLWVVGTAEGAELMGISPGRFTRLARGGCFNPVRFYVNQYLAVVWLYLAADLVEFADREPDLLHGRLPAGLRSMLDCGDDWRPRHWRGRRAGQLMSRTEDPWERAAVPAALLDADELAEVVDDPYEQAYLRRLRPELTSSRGNAVASREVIDRVLKADEPDEVLWYRLSLALSLDEAREARSAPRPALQPRTSVDAATAERAGTDRTDERAGTDPPVRPDGAGRRRTLRDWLHRRGGRAGAGA
ncbi:DUF6397 family protein [Streptomyces sp. H27-D2]|uniref:DUF6397 family protein n=1 Tax=Streptomyces sp. H27-D2 TaxID=3046304 RepID=UPI002DB868BC|nr:DUF6397 family protein [Streptomyces sp. H27-D2]MEC4020414.1 DUF6397 family protein [Streptomyces sp. H27-D2]